jgi:polysaccharide deacetylase family protein (PEP-CTERM system associated)
MTDPRPLNAMTVDVEDYYQVSAFEGVVDRARWDAYESRVERNTRRVLDVLAARDVRGTFFTLGWVADRHPDLLRELVARGHEVASHGYEHRLLTTFTPEAFRADLRRAADAIERACGVRVRGFRAPSFSVGLDNLWVHDVLREEGYLFSSSVFPVRHDRYGIPDFPRHPVVLAGADGRTIWEFPMTTKRVFGRNLPVAGGGWMRLLPGAVMRRALRRENASGEPTIVYLHPWELDPEQPRIAAAPRKARFRHYLNLGRMRDRLDRLLATFRYGTVSDVIATLDPLAHRSTWRPPVRAGLS